MIITIISYLLPVSSMLFMLLVLYRGNYKVANRDIKYFRYFLISLVLWICTLGLADIINQAPASLVLLKAALSLGSLAPAVFFIFCESFVKKRSKFLEILISVTSLLFGYLSLSDLMIKSVVAGALGIKIIDQTYLYPLQTFYTVAVFAVSLFWLSRRVKKYRDPRRDNQVKFISLGAVLALIIGIAGALILQRYDASNLLSPFAVAIFALCSFFAVFKHGLFEIRQVVVRSVIYVFTTVCIAAIFGLLVINIANLVSLGDNLDFQQQATVYAAIMFVAVVIIPLKKIFDTTTNKIFFRNAYTTQDLLNDIGSVITTNLELVKLTLGAIHTFEKYFKPLMVEYVVVNDSKIKIYRNVDSSYTSEFSNFKVADLLQYILIAKPRCIYVYDNKDSLRLLGDTKIELAVPLYSKYQIVGLVLFGAKKNGEVYTNDDIKNILIATDSLSVAMQNALRFDEISNFNKTLQEKIDDATGELRRSNQKLKALDEAKDEFISMASHQLRTPLTSVKGYVSMVLDGDAGKLTPVQEQLLEQAFTSSQRMVYLIADLLNVSRLRTGKFVIEAKPTYLPSVIEGEVAQLKETAQGRQLQLMYTKPSKFPTLMLDETKIRQVIMNFIDNAIYYTPPGGHIIVKLEETPKAIQYTVTDDGIGVPKHEQHHLFTKFYRAGNARKARPDGTGLGLFMAKKVIIAQGGAIICNSVEGKGSTFGFTFPKAKLVTKEQAVSEL